MQKSYFSCYPSFRCLAAACPDSCCVGWEIVVDSCTEATYQTVQGALGQKIRRVLTTDPDGDRIFTLLENERCPFWNTAHLCELQLELGEEGLCDTCRQFPRMKQDYGTFQEYYLSLACPEAARLILSQPRLTLQTQCAEEEQEIQADYDEKRMQFLQASREQLASILYDTAHALPERLARCLQYGDALQLQWDTVYHPQLPELPVWRSGSEIPSNWMRSLLAVHQKMECMTELFPRLLKQANQADSWTPWQKAWETKQVNYCIAMLFQYYLQAIADDAILIKLERITASLLVIGAMAQAGSLPIEQCVQLYVKEVDHSEENKVLLEEFLQTEGTAFLQCSGLL